MVKVQIDYIDLNIYGDYDGYMALYLPSRTCSFDREMGFISAARNYVYLAVKDRIANLRTQKQEREQQRGHQPRKRPSSHGLTPLRQQSRWGRVRHR